MNQHLHVFSMAIDGDFINGNYILFRPLLHAHHLVFADEAGGPFVQEIVPAVRDFLIKLGHSSSTYVHAWMWGSSRREIIKMFKIF
ncbi:hypothetical protein GT50_17575 [Geobacillus stearothermophilus 10]|nr:hypothetical protein GT50_17575 [Geobacillus stearothermophilus 10]